MWATEDVRVGYEVSVRYSISGMDICENWNSKRGSAWRDRGDGTYKGHDRDKKERAEVWSGQAVEEMSAVK